MKIMQQDGDFRPIAIVIETEDEAATFWNMMLRVGKCTEDDKEYAMSLRISNWISNQAHL